MHSDTDAIKEVLYRYSLMVDRRRWELIDEVFTSDATIDYTSVGSGGTKGPVRPMLEWLDQSLVPWPMNLHSITNEIIEIEVAGKNKSDQPIDLENGKARLVAADEILVDEQDVRRFLQGSPFSHGV